jgi:hypothetical protein
VYHLTYNGNVVAFKTGRRLGCSLPAEPRSPGRLTKFSSVFPSTKLQSVKVALFGFAQVEDRGNVRVMNTGRRAGFGKKRSCVDSSPRYPSLMTFLSRAWSSKLSKSKKAGTLIHVVSMAATMVFPSAGATDKRAYQCRGRYTRHPVNLHPPGRIRDRDIGHTPRSTDAGRASIHAVTGRYRNGCLVRGRVAGTRHTLGTDNRTDGQPSLGDPMRTL